MQRNNSKLPSQGSLRRNPTSGREYKEDEEDYESFNLRNREELRKLEKRDKLVLLLV